MMIVLKFEVVGWSRQGITRKQKLGSRLYDYVCPGVVQEP